MDVIIAILLSLSLHIPPYISLRFFVSATFAANWNKAPICEKSRRESICLEVYIAHTRAYLLSQLPLYSVNVLELVRYGILRYGIVVADSTTRVNSRRARLDL